MYRASSLYQLILSSGRPVELKCQGIMKLTVRRELYIARKNRRGNQRERRRVDKRLAHAKRNMIVRTLKMVKKPVMELLHRPLDEFG